MQVLIDTATRQVLSWGENLVGGDGEQMIEVTDVQAAKLTNPGAKTLGQNGQIAVTPPDPNAPDPRANPKRDAAIVALKGMAAGGPNAALVRAIMDLHGIA